MNGWKIGLLAWYATGVLIVVGTIGKPRKPMTPAVGVVSLVIYGALAFCVLQA